MNFPASRHLQRYEYAVQMGYVTDKDVLEVGFGPGNGAMLMSCFAKSVMGIDTRGVDSGEMLYVQTFTGYHAERVNLCHADVFELDERLHFDVATAVEVFEHVPDPGKFAFKLSKVADRLFVTTPLALETGPTENPEHVAEYSCADFVSCLLPYWDIVDLVFQHGDLTIDRRGVPGGTSMFTNHVVQMAWCRNRGQKTELA